MPRSRSPLKAKPLRVPGQSIAEERDELWNEETEPWFLLALFFVAFAGLEWIMYVRDAPRSPVLYTVVAVVTSTFAVWKIARAVPRMRQLRQGLEGERAVGQFLDERLGIRGYRVFHDVVGTHFNVDHVLIGPSGVYTVETKTLNKPASGDARITFDGQTLLVAGRALDRDPMRQAHAQAAWLRTLLHDSTGRALSVFPIVLFPGWFVEPSPGSRDRIWVLEPKALPTFLEQSPVRVSPEDVHLLAFHLSRYVRSVNVGPVH